MAYSPSKRGRLSSSSSSSSSSVDLPKSSNNTLSQRPDTTRVLSDLSSSGPFENVFRDSENPRPFKYEFPSQASLGAFQDNYTNEDDVVHLTDEATVQATDSPLRKRTTLHRISRNLHRLSGRVVNFGSNGVDGGHTRLIETTDLTILAANTQSNSLLRGRTLGLLSSTNPIRLAMYKFLIYP